MVSLSRQCCRVPSSGTTSGPHAEVCYSEAVGPLRENAEVWIQDDPFSQLDLGTI